MKEMAKARNGMAVFMAASGNQTSREGDQWQGGVFTKYLIEGLRGAADSNQNNLVTLSELAEYLPRAVIEATNARQRPEVGGNFDGSLPVGIVKKTVRK